MIFAPIPGQAGINWRLTQKFGGNHDYYQKYGLAGHNGHDIGTPVGTNLYSPIEGYVHYGDEGKIGYGKFVTITSLPYLEDGSRRQLTIGHLSHFVAGLEGKYVAAGDLVAISGNTGDSTGPHIHITYKKLDKDGKTLNRDNGFHGALDVGQYIQLWQRGNVLIIK